MELSNHSLPINPLAFPKGVKLECELCGKPAYLQCKKCRVTYYCDKEHEALDYRGIHHKICSQLSSLRANLPTLGSENERNARNEQMKQKRNRVLEITKTESEKLLFEGQYDLAIPAALQALRFSMSLSGQDSIDLVPSYLLLGKSSIGLKQYPQAEEYLSLAKWAILKIPDCDPSIRGLLHRNIGLLYSSQGNYDDALHQLALDIYYHSLAHNPEHISVSGGYYQMGNVFHKQDRTELTTSFYDKVLAIWKATLKINMEKLDVAQKAEAIQMLSTIRSFRSNYSKGLFATAEVDFVLGLLYTIFNDYDKAKEHATRALNDFEASVGREHSLTTEARNLCKSLIEGANTPASKSREARGSIFYNRTQSIKPI